MAKTDPNIHREHRKRVKDKVSNFGINVLSDHEVLELILFGCIPFKDVNPLAHTLIDRFGSLANVLDADEDSLKMVPGISTEGARYLTYQTKFWDRYRESKERDKLIFHTANELVAYFKKRYKVTDTEVLYIFCLNGMDKLKQVLVYEGMDESKILVSVKQIYKDIITSGASQIFLIHTHPNGNSIPSKEDIDFTREIITMCYTARIKVNDHMIFSEIDHSSMRDKIFEMYEEKGIDITIEPGKNKKFKFNS